ncbi:MAG: hydrogenase maturation protease [Acidimicrobiia bacterium]|nr:hydrogenase maturation protease [Acidimicrobiia bacterium]
MGSAAQHRESGQEFLTSTHPFGGTVTAPSPARAPDVVVGLGNEIAGDDGAGIAAARILGTVLADRTDVDVVPLPWAGFALLDVLRGRNRAAIIDCLTTGKHEPGSIVHIDETDMAGSVRLNSFHDISYPTVMALGREMGWQMPATIAIWGIEAETCHTFREQLSPSVAAAIHEVVEEVAAYLSTPLDRAAASQHHRPIPPAEGNETSGVTHANA